jgi:hypothetical protein
VDYSIARRDGTTQLLLGQKSIQLASPFQPLTLSQSLGLVARPIDKSYATVTLRGGAGARETFPNGVLINKDDKATLPVELVETATVIQGGVEVALGVQGKLPEQRFTYGLDVGVLLPVLNNDALNRSAAALTRVGLSGYANFSMFEWLGITYQALVQRDPQLVSGIQVQNNLFLTFKYDLIPPRKAEGKEDPLAEATAARDAALKRAQDAESRAQAAEERIKALEAAPKP